MNRLEFLYYLNRTPYKEVLACLALEEGINSCQLLDRLIDRRIGTNSKQVKGTLRELEKNGLLASVNAVYFFQEKWLKELVLFLDEFEESKKELDLCQVLLKKNTDETLFPEKEKY